MSTLQPEAIFQAMGTAEFRRDPYPLYARLREDYPACRNAQGFCYVSRYADVEVALRDPRLSNDRERMTQSLARRGGDSERLSRLTQRLGPVMTNTDPPDHGRLRKLVNKAFSAAKIRDFRPRMAAITEQLLDAVQAADSDEFELVRDLAYPLPSTVICDLLGVPPEDQRRAIDWTLRIENMADESPNAVEQAVEALRDYLQDLIRQRRIAPTDDLVSALLAVREGDDGLADDELLAACFVLLASGYETTMNLIGNTVLTLLRHPDTLDPVQAQPALLRSAIEEVLRYESPSHITIRVVAEPLVIAGETLVEGDMLCLLTAAANRDPERFPDPDRFDPRRPDNRHLSFGHGIHFCLGAPLARLETEIAVGSLLRRFPNLRLAVDDKFLEWRPNPALRGLVALPLVY